MPSTPFVPSAQNFLYRGTDISTQTLKYRLIVRTSIQCLTDRLPVHPRLQLCEVGAIKIWYCNYKLIIHFKNQDSLTRNCRRRRGCSRRWLILKCVLQPHYIHCNYGWSTGDRPDGPVIDVVTTGRYSGVLVDIWVPRYKKFWQRAEGTKGVEGTDGRNP